MCKQQVAEIDRVHRFQPLLVLPVEIDRPAMRKIAGIRRRHFFGAKPTVLPALDLRQQQAGRPAALVDVLRLQDLLQQANLVVGVEDREGRLEADRFRVAAQDARGDRMKGAEPHPFGGAADHRFEALAHLARCLVGKGDREQLGGKGAAGREDVGEPGGQHPGLAGAGAGQHQHRPFDRLDGAALSLVEIGEFDFI